MGYPAPWQHLGMSHMAAHPGYSLRGLLNGEKALLTPRRCICQSEDALAVNEKGAGAGQKDTLQTLASLNCLDGPDPKMQMHQYLT